MREIMKLTAEQLKTVDQYPSVKRIPLRPIDRNDKQKPDTSAGVSEIIGAILLISVVALAVAIIGVFLFSQTTPTQIPNLNFMTGVDNTQTTLYLYHNGGDALKVGEFSVLLDGKEASYNVSGGGSKWSLGTNLIVPISGMPQNVQIVYNGTSAGGGSVLLRQAAADIVSTVNVTADQLPYLDCSAATNEWSCAQQMAQVHPEWVSSLYQTNTTSKRISLMQQWQSSGTIVGGTRNHLNFTVSKPNSTIYIADAKSPNCDGGTVYPLTTGDKVGIQFKSNPTSFTVYGSAPQIWEITGGGNSIMKTTINFANGTSKLFDGNPICHAYINEYSILDSTLDVTTTTPGRATALIVNESHIIEGPNSIPIKLVNVHPIGNGLFLITYGANTAPIYVIGWPDAIQYYLGGVWVNQTGLGV